MKNEKKIELLISIDRYINGDLTQNEIDELWIEFLKHPDYFDYFETEIHLKSLIKKGKRPAGFKESKKNRTSSKIVTYRPWFIAAAAAVILAIGLQFFSIDSQRESESLALASIDQSEMVGSDIYRSDGETVSDIELMINEALAAAYEDEVNEAILMFRQLLNESLEPEQQVRVELNLGILLYNQGDYITSGELFESVTEIEDVNESFTEKGWWFLGNTLLNTGELVEAREAVFNAYTLNGRFQKPALALLKKLDIQLGYIPAEE